MQNDDEKPATVEAEAVTPPPPKEKKPKAPPKPKVESEFKKLSTTDELVAAYNDMVPTAVDLGIKNITPVKMFVDVPVGVKACERLHNLIIKSREPKSEDKTVAKKSKKKATTKKSKGNNNKVKRRARPKFNEEAVITFTGDIPKRKGSAAYERWDKLRKHSGKTVKAFLAASGKPATLQNAITAKCAKLTEKK